MLIPEGHETTSNGQLWVTVPTELIAATVALKVPGLLVSPI